jgi:uncharacterized protein YdeI (YjbR/CyaY-like superfamily)
MNPKADDFLVKTKTWKAEFEALRAILLECGLAEELKWRVPCYTFQGKNIALLEGFKEYCTLISKGFY